MDAKLMESLRPVDDTTGCISDALTAIANERLATEMRRVTLHGSRSATLLSGTPKQVTAIEAEMRELDILLEQLDVLANALGPKMDAAHAAEVFAGLEAKGAQVRETAERAALWWRQDYPDLARKIVEGLQLCRAAENSLNAFRHEVSTAGQNEAVAGLGDPCVDLPEPPRAVVAGVGYVPPSQAVQLPAGPEGLPAFWWPQMLYGRPRPHGF